MEPLSLFLSNLSTNLSPSAKNLLSVLSKDNIRDIAFECKACVRERKFSLSSYLLGSLSKLCSSTRSSEFTLNDFHMNYNRNQAKALKMSHKCIHKQLDSDEALAVVKTIVEQSISLFSHKLAKKIKKYLSEDLTTILEAIGVKDIILIDGTEIDLQYSCAANFGCQGKGRDRLDGESARPGAKLHVAYSLIQQTFIYIDISEAVGSERDRVLKEYLKDCLLIADRGYIDEELEQSLSEEGIQFLIRGKVNTNGTIIEAFAEDGSRLNEYIGKKLKDLPKKLNCDVTIRTAKGNTLRIIHRYNPAAKVEDKISILRTNIRRDKLGSKQIYLLYRVRWNIELFNKANKSGNNLKSINSSKKNVILIFILLSLLSSIIKTFCGTKAVLKHEITNLSLLKLHKYNDLFDDFVDALANKSRSTIYRIFKELLANIAEFCTRTTPSQRDRILLKDLPLLFWQIANQPVTSCKIA